MSQAPGLPGVTSLSSKRPVDGHVFQFQGSAGAGAGAGAGAERKRESALPELPPFTAWTPHMFKDMIVEREESRARPDSPSSASGRCLFRVLEEHGDDRVTDRVELEDDFADSDHYEDAFNGPLSPKPAVAPRYRHELQTRVATLKCASQPLIIQDSPPAWRKPLTGSSVGKLPGGGGAFYPQRVGGGDYPFSPRDVEAGVVTEDSDDSDDEDIPDLDNNRLIFGKPSVSAPVIDSRPVKVPVTSLSAAELRQGVPQPSTVRSPLTCTERSRGFGTLTGKSTRSPERPSSGTLALDVVHADGKPLEFRGEILTVRKARSALLRLKSSLIDGDLVEHGDDERPRSADSSRTYSAGAQDRKRLDFPSWLRQKRVAEEMKRLAQRQEARRRKEEEMEEEERKLRKKEQEMANFNKWLEAKREAKEREKKAAEIQRAEEEKAREEKERIKEQEEQKTREAFLKWKKKKEWQSKQKQEAEVRAKKAEEEKRGEKTMLAEASYQRWLQKQRSSSQKRAFVNPEPWVDIVPPPDLADDAPEKRTRARNKSRKSRCRRCRNQQIVSERLSRPIHRTKTIRNVNSTPRRVDDAVRRPGSGGCPPKWNSNKKVPEAVVSRRGSTACSGSRTWLGTSAEHLNRRASDSSVRPKTSHEHLGVNNRGSDTSFDSESYRRSCRLAWPEENDPVGDGGSPGAAPPPKPKKTGTRNQVDTTAKRGRSRNASSIFLVANRTTPGRMCAV